MENQIDFDEWLSNYKPVDPEYVAVFDSQTGSVISVGPAHAFETEKNKISIDRELAESIINAEIKISSCVVDINLNKLEIAEIKNVYKIDDVLHRIISTEYFDIKDPDVYLTHNLENKTLKIELSKEFGGTKKPKIPYKSRNILWDGDTEMNFFITDYNDPNVLFEIFSVKINELIGNPKIVKYFNYTNFSVYTRRLFKNYVIEYK
jgi:hypothetical protein